MGNTQTKWANRMIQMLYKFKKKIMKNTADDIKMNFTQYKDFATAE